MCGYSEPLVTDVNKRASYTVLLLLNRVHVQYRSVILLRTFDGIIIKGVMKHALTLLSVTVGVVFLGGRSPSLAAPNLSPSCRGEDGLPVDW